MCLRTNCPLAASETVREAIRVQLTAIAPFARAGDPRATSQFLEKMDKLEFINRSHPDAYLCESFAPIVGTDLRVEAHTHIPAIAKSGGLHTKDLPRFDALMNQADKKGGYISSLEWFAHRVKINTVKKIERLMRSLPTDVLCGTHYAARVTAEGAQAVQNARLSAVEGLVDTWVGSFSYSRSEGVLGAVTSSLQSAAQRFMGRGMIPSINGAMKDPITRTSDAFIEAQYELTQSFFTQQKVTHITAYRGVAARIGNPEWATDADNVPMPNVAPLSSYSLSRNVAERFAVEHERGEGIVVSGIIPVTRILAVPGTGMADLSEHEILVLTSASDQISTRFVTKQPSAV